MTDGNSDGTFVEAPVSTGKPEGRVLYVLNPRWKGVCCGHCQTGKYHTWYHPWVWGEGDSLPFGVV